MPSVTFPTLARELDPFGPTQSPSDAVQIRSLSRMFSDGSGLRPTTLTIRAGEFVSVLGPSGCGKSTLLRCIAGLETPDTGSMRFGNEVVYDDARATLVPTRDRALGMVFQDLALWPHLDAAENVAFPLRVARTPKAETQERVDDALRLVGLEHFAAKMPHELSGGQQQRVAIARAIVARPRLLLMDEPFSALDAALRLQLRDELRHLTSSLGLTTLYVTHDQSEAMAMSDRIAVLDHGILRQVAAPEEIYEAPTSRFVAEFVGQCNWLPGATGTTGVRPEHVRLTPTPDQESAHSSTASRHFTGTIVTCTYLGGRYSLTCTIDGAETPWVLEHPERIPVGSPVGLTIRETALINIPSQ